MIQRIRRWHIIRRCLLFSHIYLDHKPRRRSNIWDSNWSQWRNPVALQTTFTLAWIIAFPNTADDRKQSYLVKNLPGFWRHEIHNFLIPVPFNWIKSWHVHWMEFMSCLTRVPRNVISCLYSSLINVTFGAVTKLMEDIFHGFCNLLDRHSG